MTPDFSKRTMNAWLAGLLACVLACSERADANNGRLENLEQLNWAHRIILVHAPSELADNAVINLEEREAGIEERDIVWFVLDDHTLRTNYRGPMGENLPEQLSGTYFSPAQADTAVVLIGKDGLIKSRSPDLDLEGTFELIDRMPMRRQEIRRQSSGRKE
jgi:hypothetical protein